MTFDRPRHILLYWGGEITYEGCIISYRPMVCKKLFRIKQRIRFVELVDKIYEFMEIDREQLKLNILYRHIVSRGVYSGIPLTDDDGMDGIFDLFDADPTFCVELFIETEEISQVPKTNNLELYGMGPMMSLMHSTMNDKLLQSNARSLFEHPWSYEFYNPTCSFLMSNSISSDQSISAQYNRDTTAGEGPSTMQYQHMEKGLVDEGLTDDNANSKSSWHALDENYESMSNSKDISEDKSDDDLETNNGECHMQENIHVYQPRGMAFFNDIGNYGDYDPMDRSDKDGLVYWNEKKNDIRLHMCFDSKEQVSKAVRIWSIAQKREFKVIESQKKTWAAKCKTASSGRLVPGECDWSIRVRENESLNVWKVTKWVKDHVCLGEISANNNRNLTSTVIANQMMHLIKNDHGHKVKQVQAYIKNNFKVDITYKKAWYARKKAIVLAYGNWTSSFQQLPRQIRHFAFESLHAVGESTRLDLRPPTVPAYIRHPHQAHDPHRVERVPRRDGQHGGGRQVPSPRPHVDAGSPHVNIQFKDETSQILSPMRTSVGPSSFGPSSTGPDPEHTGPSVSDEEHEHEQNIISQSQIAHPTQERDTPLFYVRRSKRMLKPRECGTRGRIGDHGH